MGESLGKIFGWIIGISAMLLFFYVSDWGFLKSEITEYPVLCSEKLEFGTCKGQKVSLNLTTYQILQSRQEVLYWHPTVKLSIEKLTRCAIKNRRNWSCKYDDESGKIGFTDGNYWTISLKPGIANELDEEIYYVSRLEYLRILWLE